MKKPQLYFAALIIATTALANDNEKAKPDLSQSVNIPTGKLAALSISSYLNAFQKHSEHPIVFDYDEDESKIGALIFGDTEDIDDAKKILTEFVDKKLEAIMKIPDFPLQKEQFHVHYLSITNKEEIVSWKDGEYILH